MGRPFLLRGPFPAHAQLAFTSPEKRCGKTTALDAVGLVACRPLVTANVTAAAIFRTIEAAGPTLLIDEADTFLRDNEDLRGILNAGQSAAGKSSAALAMTPSRARSRCTARPPSPQSGGCRAQ